MKVQLQKLVFSKLLNKLLKTKLMKTSYTESFNIFPYKNDEKFFWNR